MQAASLAFLLPNKKPSPEQARSTAQRHRKSVGVRNIHPHFTSKFIYTASDTAQTGVQHTGSTKSFPYTPALLPLPGASAVLGPLQECKAGQPTCCMKFLLSSPAVPTDTAHAPQYSPAKHTGEQAPAECASSPALLPLLHAIAGAPSPLSLALAASLQLSDMQM